MGHFRPRVTDDWMRHETTRELFRYWNEVRERALQPRSRRDRSVRDRHVLADTFLLEKDRTGVSGARVGHAARRPVARRSEEPLLSRFLGRGPPFGRGRTVDGDGRREPGRPGREGRTRRPRRVSASRACLLPLRHHGRTHSLVLGVLSLAEPPSWIGLVPIDHLRLVSLRVLTPPEVGDAAGARTELDAGGRIHRTPRPSDESTPGGR